MRSLYARMARVVAPAPYPNIPVTAVRTVSPTPTAPSASPRKYARVLGSDTPRPIEPRAELPNCVACSRVRDTTPGIGVCSCPVNPSGAGVLAKPSRLYSSCAANSSSTSSRKLRFRTAGTARCSNAGMPSVGSSTPCRKYPANCIGLSVVAMVIVLAMESVA